MGCTLKDVALAVGVSPATASLALNNKSGISEKTREAVIEAAMKLNYSFHTSGNKSKTFRPICFIKIAVHGLVVNDDHKGFIADYIDGIEKEARKADYSLEVRTYNEFNIQVILNDIYKQAYSGVIILATELLEQDILKFKGLSIPKIFIDASYPFHSFDFVNMDNQSALYTVIKKFIEKGITKIGLIRSKVVTRNFELRSEFFYEALKYFRLEANPTWDLAVGLTFDEAYNDMLQYLDGGNSVPEGFFCVCDIMGLGIMRALKERKIRVPAEVSVVGFDDLPQCQMVDPSLSSVKVSKNLMGKRAFQYLEKMMSSEKRIASEKTYIGCEIVQRESLRP